MQDQYKRHPSFSLSHPLHCPSSPLSSSVWALQVQFWELSAHSYLAVSGARPPLGSLACSFKRGTSLRVGLSACEDVQGALDQKGLEGQAVAWLHQLDAPSAGKPSGASEPRAQQRWLLDSFTLAEQVLYPWGDVSKKAPWGRAVGSLAASECFVQPFGLRFGGSFDLAERRKHRSWQN